MITSIIFSKNRPLQLDLTLKSLIKNFNQSKNIHVIYSVTPEFEESYELIKQEYLTVTFTKQKEYLLQDIIKATATNDDFICFFTDDNIVYKNTILSNNELNILNSPEMSCISLRLGRNTTMRDYGDGLLRSDFLPLQISRYENLFVWNRLSVPPGGYWAYPLSVDGHIFKKDILSVILSTMNNWPEVYGSLQTPNKFESLLQRFFFEIPVLMSCLKESTVVNSPNNRVQAEYKNSHGKRFSYDPLLLNELFLKGERIKLDVLDFTAIVCPHQEIDILKGLSWNTTY